MDVATLLIEDHRRISRLFDDVSSGDMTAVPQACDELLVHSRMAEEVLYPALAWSLEGEWDAGAALKAHRTMRCLAAELAEETTITPWYVSRAGTLMRLVSDHVREEEEVLLPRLRCLGSATSPPPGAMDVPPEPDPGASSDGDASWAESPLTQDPGIDRSVDAVIRRTQGV